MDRFLRVESAAGASSSFFGETYMRMHTLHVCMLMYVWTGRWADVCVSKYVCVCVCVCARAYVSLSMSLNVYVFSYAYRHGCMGARMHACN